MTTKAKTAVVVTAPAPLTEAQAQTVTNLVLAGDLSKMDAEARVRYYVQLCESLHLNPLTQPFQILKLSGREVLYATKSCTEQLRKMQGVSVTRLEPRNEGDVYLVVATVQDATGRTDAATGAVPVTNLKGEALANAFMKAETKAKRRATLSICGLGFMDESELDTLPQGQKIPLPAAAEIGTGATVVETPKKAAAEASVPASAPLAVSAGADESGELNEVLEQIAGELNSGHITSFERTKMLAGLSTLTLEQAKNSLANLSDTIEFRISPDGLTAARNKLREFANANASALGQETYNYLHQRSLALTVTAVDLHHDRQQAEQSLKAPQQQQAA